MRATDALTSAVGVVLQWLYTVLTSLFVLSVSPQSVAVGSGLKFATLPLLLITLV